MSNRITKGLAGLAALVVIGVGAALIGGTSSGDASNNRNASGFGPPGMQGGPPGSGQGMDPGGAPGGGAGFGTAATGADATKAKAAALAKYPGTAERVMKLDDGSYVVHVIRSSGEVHVLVSKDFKVTGVEQRPAGPPSGFGPNGGKQGQPPAGSGAPGGSGSGSGTPPAPPSGSGTNGSSKLQ